MQNCPRRLACALLLTILVKKGNTHWGEWLKASAPCPHQFELWILIFHPILGASWESRNFNSLRVSLCSPVHQAWLKTQWNFAKSSPFSTSHLTWRKAGLFNGVFPLLPPACRVSGNHGFPAAFHIRISGLEKAATMGALCVCVCTSGERCQDMEWENTRGPTADSSCQTSCFIHGWGGCLPVGWLGRSWWKDGNWGVLSATETEGTTPAVVG